MVHSFLYEFTYWQECEDCTWNKTTISFYIIGDPPEIDPKYSHTKCNISNTEFKKETNPWILYNGRDPRKLIWKYLEDERQSFLEP